MKRLSSKAYWASRHVQARHAIGTRPTGRSGLTIRALAQRILGRTLLSYSESHREYLLWTAVYDRLLPAGKEISILEVGSAPGLELVKFHSRYGYDPFGVEYTDEGTALTRDVFATNGLDPSHVIQADFFDPAFLGRYRDRFDVVFSRGFIEHFEEPAVAVANHLALLRNGGWLVVVIPNLRSMNACWSAFFSRETHQVHNLEIMKPEAFRSLFGQQDLETLFCGYVGPFDFGLFQAPVRSLRWYVLRGCQALQRGPNLLYRILLGPHVLSWGSWSPYLVYIGRKNGQSPHRAEGICEEHLQGERV